MLYLFVGDKHVKFCHEDNRERVLKMEVARSVETLGVRSEKTIV